MPDDDSGPSTMLWADASVRRSVSSGCASSPGRRDEVIHGPSPARSSPRMTSTESASQASMSSTRIGGRRRRAGPARSSRSGRAGCPSFGIASRRPPRRRMSSSIGASGAASRSPVTSTPPTRFSRAPSSAVLPRPADPLTTTMAGPSSAGASTRPSRHRPRSAGRRAGSGGAAGGEPVGRFDRVLQHAPLQRSELRRRVQSVVLDEVVGELSPCPQGADLIATSRCASTRRAASCSDVGCSASQWSARSATSAWRPWARSTSARSRQGGDDAPAGDAVPDRRRRCPRRQRTAHPASSPWQPRGCRPPRSDGRRQLLGPADSRSSARRLVRRARPSARTRRGCGRVETPRSRAGELPYGVRSGAA